MAGVRGAVSCRKKCCGEDDVRCEAGVRFVYECGVKSDELGVPVTIDGVFTELRVGVISDWVVCGELGVDA